MNVDVVIIGVGIVGISLVVELVLYCWVVLIEVEEMLGYYSIGCFVVNWYEMLGGFLVQLLIKWLGVFLCDNGFFYFCLMIEVVEVEGLLLFEMFEVDFIGMGVWLI